MMYRIIYLLCFFFYFTTGWAQQNLLDTPFIQTYEGFINGKLPIVINLTNWGNNSLSGSYFYKKVGTKIELFGEFSSATAFEIKEYVEGAHTGTFKGAFDGITKMKGYWINPKNNKQYPFEATVKTSNSDVSGWAGAWYLNDVWDGGTLIIGNVRKDSFSFALSVFRGGHMGEIEGLAHRKGNKASFKNMEFNFGAEEKEACALIFELKGNHIQIEQVSSGMACGFGMRAYASGRFDDHEIEMKATLSFGDKEAHVFETQQQHDGFKKLLSEDMYELFAFNMQGFERRDQEAADGFRANVVVGAAIGMYMTNEAIIMYDNAGKYWAATLDFDKDNNGLVRYFTNDNLSKNKLPATIEAWRERFQDYALRVESK